MVHLGDIFLIFYQTNAYGVEFYKTQSNVARGSGGFPRIDIPPSLNANSRIGPPPASPRGAGPPADGVCPPVSAYSLSPNFGGGHQAPRGGLLRLSKVSTEGSPIPPCPPEAFLIRHTQDPPTAEIPPSCRSPEEGPFYASSTSSRHGLATWSPQEPQNRPLPMRGRSPPRPSPSNT